MVESTRLMPPIALVTGASSGIGAASVRLLAEPRLRDDRRGEAGRALPGAGRGGRRTGDRPRRHRPRVGRGDGRRGRRARRRSSTAPAERSTSRARRRRRPRRAGGRCTRRTCSASSASPRRCWIASRRVDGGTSSSSARSPGSRSTRAEAATPRPSTRSTRSSAPSASSCWGARCGSPRSPRAWSRPSSPWSASSGDEQRAAEVYRGIDPLSAADVAEVIAFALERPANVNIDYVAVKPVAQATAMVSHRRE